MREDRKESFRTWATLVVSAAALLVTSLRQPLAWTLRSAVQDVLHEELVNYGNLAGLEAGREKRLVSELDSLSRIEHDMAALREESAATQATHKLLAGMSNSLCSIEARLDRLSQATNRIKKPQAGAGP